MEFIVMAENTVTKEVMQDTYPLPVYRYVCTVGGDTMHFSEVSGLDITYDPIMYADGIKVQYMPGQRAATDISFKRGILKNDSAFYSWISETSLNLINKRDLLISLTEATGATPLVTWKVTDAFPTGLIGPSFNAGSNEVSIETLNMRGQTVSITTWD
jgi:phage tail-like protein